MSKKRKVYSPGFRAKVAMAAAKGDRTIHQLASDFEVSPQMVSNWKARLFDTVEELFQDKSARKKDEMPDVNVLFEEIGRLKVELDLVKKKAARFGG